MSDCKWVQDEICVNGACDYVSDFCPFFEKFDACRFSSQNKERFSEFVSRMEKTWREALPEKPEYAAGIQYALMEFIKEFRGGI